MIHWFSVLPFCIYNSTASFEWMHFEHGKWEKWSGFQFMWFHPICNLIMSIWMDRFTFGITDCWISLPKNCLVRLLDTASLIRSKEFRILYSFELCLFIFDDNLKFALNPWICMNNKYADLRLFSWLNWSGPNGFMVLGLLKTYVITIFIKNHLFAFANNKHYCPAPCVLHTPSLLKYVKNVLLKTILSCFINSNFN